MMGIARKFVFQKNNINPDLSLMFLPDVGAYHRGNLKDMLQSYVLETIAFGEIPDTGEQYKHSFIGEAHEFEISNNADVQEQVKQMREIATLQEIDEFLQIVFNKIAKMNQTGEFMTWLHVVRLSTRLSKKGVPFFIFEAVMYFGEESTFSFTVKY